MSKGSVIIRVDGDLSIGFGHLYRGIALAEMLQEEFDIAFWVRETTITTPIEKEGYNVSIIPKNIEIQNEPSWIGRKISSDSIIVLDGYVFNLNYQGAVKNAGFKLVVIDDFVSSEQVADLILNHCPGVQNLDYGTNVESIKFGLGLGYAMLRKPFIEFDRSVDKSISNISSVLVSFGGSSPSDFLISSVNVLQEIDNIEQIDILGTAKPEMFKSIKKLVFHEDLNDVQVFDVMRNVDLAIVPSSTISLELASIGVPMVLGYFIDNQKKIYSGLQKDESVYGVGDYNVFDFNLLQQIIQLFKKRLPITTGGLTRLFEGNPKRNILKLFRQLNVSIREATVHDLHFVFELANDKEVRDNSYNSKAISLQEHTSWYNKQLESNEVKFFIICFGNQRIGQVRFVISPRSALIGISIIEEFRGKSLGAEILLKSVRFFRQTNDEPILAYIKKSNTPSMKSFEKADFRIYEEKIIDGVESFIYKNERN